MGRLPWGSRRGCRHRRVFRRDGIPGERGFPCLHVPEKIAPEPLRYCANCAGPTRGALACCNDSLLVTKREETSFSAQLRFKTLLLGLCWRPHASLWGWWHLALSSPAANSRSKPWGGCEKLTRCASAGLRGRCWCQDWCISPGHSHAGHSSKSSSPRHVAREDKARQSLADAQLGPGASPAASLCP